MATATGISKKATKRQDHIWHGIPGWEDKYEVSNRGRVRRLAYDTYKGETPIHFRERILKGTLRENGTVTVRLLDEQAAPYKWHTKFVHQLICEAFPSIDEMKALDLAEDEHGDEIDEATYRSLQTWVTHGVAAKRRPLYDAEGQRIVHAIRSAR